MSEFTILKDADGAHFGTADQALGFFGADPVVQQDALTAADAGTVDATYGAPEAAVLANVRTRVNEIEAALVALGLIAE